MYTCLRLTKYVPIIIVIVLLWIFFRFASDARRIISHSRRSLHIMSTAKWSFLSHWLQGRYVNLAGFRSTDGFAWGMLGNWSGKCGTLSYCLGNPAWPTGMTFEEDEWANVIGTLSGEWVRHIYDGNEKTSGHLDLRKIAPGVSWAFWDPEDWTMNVTGNEGRVLLRIDEKASLEMEIEQEPDMLVEESELGEIWETGISRRMALIREVAATMTIHDESSNDHGWQIRVHGLHWPRTGVLLLTTTSQKFAGIFGLPYLIDRKDYFRTSQRLLNATIGKTLEGMEKDVWNNGSSPWTTTPGMKADATRPVPHCEYVVYVQMHPRENTFVKGLSTTQETVSEIKKYSTCSWGASTPRIHELQMSMVIFSPDCGFILESKGLPEFVSAKEGH